ncbi:hypothetical protein V7S43_004617 [Phytophthora oleae]|uniref:Uncharacterized protein n=1 Tax=Phytophthora oleae TaxID=2107226 RepID=A0ABD3FVG2_9STRA
MENTAGAAQGAAPNNGEAQLERTGRAKTMADNLGETTAAPQTDAAHTDTDTAGESHDAGGSADTGNAQEEHGADETPRTTNTASAVTDQQSGTQRAADVARPGEAALMPLVALSSASASAPIGPHYLDTDLRPWQLYDLSGASAPDSIDTMIAYWSRYRALRGKTSASEYHALQYSWCAFIKRWNERHRLGQPFVVWLEDEEEKRRCRSLGALRKQVCTMAWEVERICFVEVVEGCRVCEIGVARRSRRGAAWTRPPACPYHGDEQLVDRDQGRGRHQADEDDEQRGRSSVRERSNQGRKRRRSRARSPRGDQTHVIAYYASPSPPATRSSRRRQVSVPWPEDWTRTREQYPEHHARAAHAAPMYQSQVDTRASGRDSGAAQARRYSGYDWDRWEAYQDRRGSRYDPRPSGSRQWNQPAAEDHHGGMAQAEQAPRDAARTDFGRIVLAESEQARSGAQDAMKQAQRAEDAASAANSRAERAEQRSANLVERLRVLERQLGSRT